MVEVVAAVLVVDHAPPVVVKVVEVVEVVKVVEVVEAVEAGPSLDHARPPSPKKRRRPRLRQGPQGREILQARAVENPPVALTRRVGRGFRCVFVCVYACACVFHICCTLDIYVSPAIQEFLSYAMWPSDTAKRLVDSESGEVNKNICLRFVQYLDGTEDMTTSVMDTAIKWLTREIQDQNIMYNKSLSPNMVRSIPGVSRVSLIVLSIADRC